MIRLESLYTTVVMLLLWALGIYVAWHGDAAMTFPFAFMAGYLLSVLVYRHQR